MLHGGLVSLRPLQIVLTNILKIYLIDLLHFLLNSSILKGELGEY